MKRRFFAAFFLTLSAFGLLSCAGDPNGGGTYNDENETLNSETVDNVPETSAETEKEKEKEEYVPEEGILLYYDMTALEGEKNVIADVSGNGNNAKLYGSKAKLENGELFLTDGAYAQLPDGIFDGKDTLTISVWLNNYTGSGNYSAMFIGTKESMPKGYWLLNPCNPSGKMKSVITNSVNASAPYNTEVGISATTGGKSGPATGIGWNHYVTVITESSISSYFNGELIGSSKIQRNVSDFGNGLVAYLGRSSYDDPTYMGFIKEVKVFERELTADEISAEYLRCKPEDKVYADSEYSNPLIEERADPYIIKADDGYYYFTSSYPQRGNSDGEGYDRVILRRSETLEGLADAEEITIWDEKESKNCYRYIWAPELHKIGGKWYVYFAGSTSANSVWDIRCFVLACDSDDPYTGNWELKGKFRPSAGDTFSFSGFSLDMTYFENEGKHYVIWAQKANDCSNLYIAEIDPASPWKLTSKATLLATPEYYWEEARYKVCEGPSVLIHDGKVMVFYSAAGTGPEYCVGLITADVTSDLLKKKSWTKYEEPVLTSEDLEGEYGPGHNSFTVDEEGNTVFVYHARSEKCFLGKCGFAGQDPLVDPCRHARIRRVYWTEDGMPILNSVK